MAGRGPSDSTHRIFATQWLHALQVRYPWFCGYAAAPVAFSIGRAYGLNNLSPLSLLQPLLADTKNLAALRSSQTVSATLFDVHFVRRALEVLYVNDYTGTFNRDSRWEIVYYLVWGLIAGAATGTTALKRHGVASGKLRLVGAILNLIGQAGNTWCHLELRRLRAERAALGTHTYVIPSRGLFQYVVAPHYTFELLTWLGFALHNGVDATSVLLFGMSVVAMGSFANDRYERLVQIFLQNAQRHPAPDLRLDPRMRWKMVPLVW